MPPGVREKRKMNLADLTIDIAKTLEGTTFTVTLSDGRTLPMKLDAALSYERKQRRPARGAPPVKREPFTLFFLGPPDPILEQSMYTFRGERESFENLFIVPIGRDAEATEYEAVFT
jgi:hypothetical protein